MKHLEKPIDDEIPTQEEVDAALNVQMTKCTKELRTQCIRHLRAGNIGAIQIFTHDLYYVPYVVQPVWLELSKVGWRLSADLDNKEFRITKLDTQQGKKNDANKRRDKTNAEQDINQDINKCC